MQPNEIIEENSLESISRKTRLSVDNIEKIFRMDFTGLIKVQALGFISILEREYRTDLNELRAGCIAHFDAVKSSSEEDPEQEAHRNPPLKASVITDMTTERRRAFPWKPLLGLFLAVVLVYAAWLTYASNRGLDTASDARQGKNAGFFARIVQQTQSWFGGTTDGNVDGAQEGTGVVSENNQSDGAFEIAKATPTTPATQTPASNESTAETVQQPKAAETPAVSTEEMQQIGDAISTATDTATDPQEPLATEVPSTTSADAASEEHSIIKEATERALRDAAEAKAREEEAARKQAEEEARRQAAEEAARKKAAEEAARLEAAKKKAAAEKAARQKALRAAGVTLIPRSKVWLGVVDLLTMRRTTSVGKKHVAFKNPDGGKWIIATGHGRITLKMLDSEMKINDGKKHFILIQAGTAKEISHEEFQSLNKSTVW